MRADWLELRVPPLALTVAAAIAVVVTALSASFLHRFQIAPEERWLGKQFGAEFDAYRARVRRWL